MGRHFGEFIVASMLIIIVPGPSVTFTIARAIAWGRRVAVLSVLGNSIGTFVLAQLVALGLGPLLSHSALFSTVLQVAGGIYLLYLGGHAWQHREAAALAMTNQSGAAPTAVAIVRQGFIVGILNPKSLVFFGAVFPHFVDRVIGNETRQLILFGCIFAVLAFFSDGTWGLIAGTARTWLSTNRRRIVRMRIVAAAVMVALGVLIIVSALNQ